MSGSRSLFRQVLRTPSDSFKSGEPLDTHRALCIRNNIQFLIEQSAQHRVNWVAANEALFPELASIGLDRFMVDNSGGSDPLTRTWSLKFEHTWLRPDFPTGLDIYATALSYGAASTYKLIVRIVPARAAVGDTSAAWYEDTVTTTSGATTFTSEAQVTFEDGKDPNEVFAPQSVTEPDGALRSPRIAIMRIDCELTVPASEKAWLTGVLVREFSWQ